MAECQRLASSGAEEYCEFQAIEMNEQPVTAEKVEHRIFDAPDTMDMKTWSERDAKAFDVVFMTIEDGDFNKY